MLYLGEMLSQPPFWGLITEHQQWKPQWFLSLCPCQLWIRLCIAHGT